MQEEILRRLLAADPEAQVTLTDMTGGGDHWAARVVSPRFEGQTPIARHRAVYAALGELMAGPIHALKLETLTPAQAGD